MSSVELRFLTPREAAALRGGELPAGLARHPEYPMSESLDAVGLFLQLVEATGDPSPWGIALVVDPFGAEVVGDAGFHGPPGPGTPVLVEIGYSIVAARRGAGLGTTAGRLLVQHAWDHGAELVRAETTPTNLASQRVLQALDFTARGPNQAGDLVFERVRP